MVRTHPKAKRYLSLSLFAPLTLRKNPASSSEGAAGRRDIAEQVKT